MGLANAGSAGVRAAAAGCAAVAAAAGAERRADRRRARARHAAAAVEQAAAEHARASFVLRLRIDEVEARAERRRFALAGAFVSVVSGIAGAVAGALAAAAAAGLVEGRRALARVAVAAHAAADVAERPGGEVDELDDLGLLLGGQAAFV